MREDFTLIVAFLLSITGYFYINELIFVSAALIYIHIAFPNLSKRISFYIGNILIKIFHSLSVLVLSLIFIIILTPIGILYRKFKGDPLLLKKSNLTSTWKEKNQLFTSSDLEIPYWGRWLWKFSVFLLFIMIQQPV